MDEFNAWAITQGFDPATMTETQRTALQSAWRAELRERDGVNKLHDRYVSAPHSMTAAEKNLLRQHSTPTMQAAQLAALRGDRFRGELQPVGSGAPAMSQVAEAGLLVHCDIDLAKIGQLYGPQVADAASMKRNRVGGIQALMRQALAAAGRHVPSGKFTDSDIVDVFRASQPMMDVGPSTYSLPNILANVANKMLLIAFMNTPTTYGLWAKKGSNPDFKDGTRYRLTGIGSFQEIAPGGEIKAVSLAEAGVTAALKSYGALIGIDRRDIINDDLSAFASTPSILARMCAIKIEKTAVAKLLENSGGTATGFFSTGNANYLSGAGSALADAGLADAYQTFAEQTDANGDPIMVPPRILAVPPAIETTALKLIASTAMVGSTTADELLPSGNPWAGKFSVVPIPYLASSFGLTNSSDTGWYLLVAPGDYSCVEVNFLDGNESPTIETAEFDFDRLGVSMRAFHDFSANTLEPRGGVLNAGT